MKKMLLGVVLAFSCLLFSCNGNSSSGPDKKEGGGIEVPCNAENEGEVVSPADSDKEYICKNSSWNVVDSSRHCEDCKNEEISTSSSSSSNNDVILSTSDKSSSSVIASVSDESSSSVIASETKQSSSEQSTESSNNKVGDSSSSVETTEESSSSEETSMFLCDDGVTYVLDLANCEVESSSSDDAEESSSSEEVEDSNSSETITSSSSENVEESSSSEESVESSSSEESVDESSSSIEQLGICNTEISDNCQYDILHDIRDDKNYKIVKIGTQWWMAENLNFESAQSRCYGEEKENCEKYGRLYLFSEARNVCPDDWSLPTYSDWNKLKKFIQDNVASNTNLGMTLRSKIGWDETGTGKGLDYFGFNALPGGFYKTLNYDEEYKTVYFWEDYIYEEGAFFVYISYKSMSLGDFVIGYRAGNYLLNYADYAMTSTQRAYYVRCVKE